MAKVIMMCGRLCSGKSTYAEQLRLEYNAVVLSVDEITLALFDQQVGEKHDDYVRRIEEFLFEKSVQCIETGINVILDWGFWTKAERTFAKEFYRTRGIAYEFHYLDIDDDIWQQRLTQRNQLISEGKVKAYFVDQALTDKFNSIFEAPEGEEVVYVKY